MESLLERISGLRTPKCPDQLLNKQQPSVQDIGVDYLGERLGGCQRAFWYKAHDVAPTNEEKDHLVVADYLEDPIKKIVLEKIRNIVRPRIVEPHGWYVPVGDRNMWCYLDAKIPTATPNISTGVLIFVGSGYGFRSEVFGARQRPGAIKDNHLVQAWSTMALYQTPDGKMLDKIEIIYYDRGQLDAISYVVDSCPIEKRDIIQSIAIASGPDLPDPSFERVWTSREKVAKLYASKKLSKEKYETWMDSGIGGDWQCQYCPFLDQCTKES